MTVATARRLWPVALPVLATIWFVVGLAVVVVFAGDTLGYDYQAYVGAAQRVLDGQPLYDTSVDTAGPFAIFLYPPPFAVAFIPFALLPSTVGVWLWTLLSIAMVAAAIALLPVRVEVRWVVLLLAGIDWPVAYAIKLGQVGPLLLLVFAIGWRWLDRPVVVAASMAVGTMVKLQPALLLVWAALTRQPRTLALGIAMLIAVGLVTLPIVGVTAWTDYATVIRAVTDPIGTPNNYTLGAIAARAGASEALAAIIQLWAMVVAAGLWLAICRRGSLGASFVATVVTSQLLSPLLWDHYALLLLLPVALLLERRWWWAVVIPLPTTTFAALSILGPLYPWLIQAGFVGSLVALLLVPDREREPA